jgi:hypothetical protein
MKQEKGVKTAGPSKAMNLGPHQLGLKEQTAYLSNNPKIKITELPVQLVTAHRRKENTELHGLSVINLFMWFCFTKLKMLSALGFQVTAHTWSSMALLLSWWCPVGLPL